MKFTVQMKDPDTLYDSIDEAVKASLAAELPDDPDEREAVAEVRKQKVQKLCSKWFSYGEYLAVEIDTDAETCVVKPAR